ncbi:unnamed protein product [Protopolystoma xenopodis]|uniref:Uncharacterized protein n=1 Tax=Protopolystoma xenopodis TaxID=117903 RepID=A0A3S5FD97_9PLAT|nr:unnamed protein product [Protopolystoma xenopodis]
MLGFSHCELNIAFLLTFSNSKLSASRAVRGGRSSLQVLLDRLCQLVPWPGQPGHSARFDLADRSRSSRPIGQSGAGSCSIGGQPVRLSQEPPQLPLIIAFARDFQLVEPAIAFSNAQTRAGQTDANGTVSAQPGTIPSSACPLTLSTSLGLPLSSLVHTHLVALFTSTAEVAGRPHQTSPRQPASTIGLSKLVGTNSQDPLARQASLPTNAAPQQQQHMLSSTYLEPGCQNVWYSALKTSASAIDRHKMTSKVDSYSAHSELSLYRKHVYRVLERAASVVQVVHSTLLQLVDSTNSISVIPSAWFEFKLVLDELWNTVISPYDYEQLAFIFNTLENIDSTCCLFKVGFHLSMVYIQNNFIKGTQ